MNQSRQPAFLETSRRDLWWIQPLLVFTTLSTVLIYMTWAAFQNSHYALGNYLSPLYSPEIFGDSPHSWLGPKPEWWPAWLPFSPALLILPFPGLFRFTCYYYRGAYYKAFWADPIACAVGEPRKSYWGERSLPLVLQNVHRYFMYIALIFLVFLSYDVWLALWFTNPTTGQTEFGIGVGTLILAVSVVLLSSYTLGCHSLRHLLDRPKCYTAYCGVSCLNRKHMLFAWMSLFTVSFSDLYIRLCSMGIWHDWRIF